MYAAAVAVVNGRALSTCGRTDGIEIGDGLGTCGIRIADESACCEATRVVPVVVTNVLLWGDEKATVGESDALDEEGMMSAESVDTFVSVPLESWRHCAGEVPADTFGGVLVGMLSGMQDAIPAPMETTSVLRAAECVGERDGAGRSCRRLKLI